VEPHVVLETTLVHYECTVYPVDEALEPSPRFELGTPCLQDKRSTK
jgi:hypothetical protein